MYDTVPIDVPGVVRSCRAPTVSRRETPRHHLCERLALEELHDDEVLPLVLLDGVNRADARMVQRRGGTRLALEALERRSVLGKLGGQELERDAAAEARVLRLVHDAHPTASETAHDRVMGTLFPIRGSIGLDTLRQRLPQARESCRPEQLVAGLSPSSRLRDGAPTLARLKWSLR
jgi:hypothetical protein